MPETNSSRLALSNNVTSPVCPRESLQDFNYFSVFRTSENIDPDKTLIERLQIQMETIYVHGYTIRCSKDIKRIIKTDIACFVVGDLYGHGNDEVLLKAATCAEEVKRFDGFFSLIFVSEKGLRVVTDQLCRFPLYYSKGVVALSTHVYEIASFVQAAPDVGRIGYYFSTKQDLPGETIYVGVVATRHESVLDLGAPSAEERSYQVDEDFIDGTRSLDALAADLLAIIRSGYEYLATEKRCKSIVCDLSGGTDSRVTTLLAHRFFDRIFVNTGVKSNDSARVQAKEREVATKINREFLNDSPTIRRNTTGDIEGEENFDVLIGGVAGEIFKDFFIKRIFPRSRLLKSGVSDGALFFIVKSKMLSGKSEVRYMIEHIRSSVKRDLRADKIVDQIYIKYFVSVERDRYRFRPDSTRFQMNWNPFLSNKFILYCRRIDPRDRAYHNIHSRMVESMDENCARVETNTPVLVFYPFRMVSVDRGKAFRYWFWTSAYNLERLARKVVALAKTTAKKKSETLVDEKCVDKDDVVDPRLLRIAPELELIDEPSRVQLLNASFAYLPYD